MGRHVNNRLSGSPRLGTSGRIQCDQRLGRRLNYFGNAKHVKVRRFLSKRDSLHGHMLSPLPSIAISKKHCKSIHTLVRLRALGLRCCIASAFTEVYRKANFKAHVGLTEFNE